LGCIWATLEEKGMDDASLTPFRASVWLRTVDKETVTAFAAKHPLFHGTTGAGDIMYTPAGYVVAEQTGQSSDVVGFIMRGYAAKDPRAASVLGSLAQRCASTQSEAQAAPMREVAAAITAAAAPPSVPPVQPQ
jgi:hypothetical protein